MLKGWMRVRDAHRAAQTACESTDAGLLLTQQLDESLPSERCVRRGKPDADWKPIASQLQAPYPI
eukprot:3202895-Amphidinium_carterae.2